MLEFVIDSSGHPVQETMHDVWPRDKPRLMGETEKAYEEFVAASEAAVRDWKFYPARIGACHVPQIVQLPMQYVAPTRSMPHSH